jgi:hypothetical protein
MWKVKNEINARHVFKYNTRIIMPFFRLWLKVALEDNLVEKLAEGDFWEKYLTKSPIINERFLDNNKKGHPIKPLLGDIVQLGHAVLKTELERYLAQNREVYNGNYNIPKLIHPDPITDFFKHYLYDFYWGKSWVWTDIVGITFSRGTFHNNFKRENKLTICSYCDVDTIAAAINSSIEHFLPKDHFPLVACNPRNLIPCCNACNMPSSGKGAGYRSPIYSQFNRQMGDDVQFKFQNNSMEILPHEDPATENFIDLLKLRARYKEVPVHTSVIKRFTINYNLFARTSGGNVDRADFLQYVQEIGRESGHYFVQRDLLNYASSIILPKKL